MADRTRDTKQRVEAIAEALCRHYAHGRRCREGGGEVVVDVRSGPCPRCRYAAVAVDRALAREASDG